ncbi:unnamed protein product [marine sediment metagenome]|uniref:Uncharacterized protein n=1 Tax=marine sediment metagenome TaxID=412755 RepID=X1LEF2_9ZZZZ
MGKWFRCPICGKYSIERNIDKNFQLQVFNQVGLGRAKGWRYDPIIDNGILDRVKNRIKFLYELFFEPQYLKYGNRPNHLFIGKGKPTAYDKGDFKL